MKILGAVFARGNSKGIKNKKNQTYIDQHLDVLNNQLKNLCSIAEAKNTLSLIKKLKD